jgi:protein-ribulosamine 3-kinase
MMEGEFNAMCELHKTMPTFVPKPHTWGKFDLASPQTYFFLCDFIDMSNNLPDPVAFCSRLAELHRTSESPTGKFGFHIVTCHGRFPQVVDWDSSWTSFFTKLLKDALRLDNETNGRWEALDKVSLRVLTRVLPRLLGVLESDGRSVEPSLIHGDLWEGNIGTEFETGNVFIFDSGAYYAHNEMEIGMWRCERHKIRSKVYKREYLRRVIVSEPADEWDDRNRIYCVKMNMIHSAHHPDSIIVRQT